MWSFIYAKEKNVADARKAPANAGDVWTWVAVDAETKPVPSWRVGDRSSETAIAFVDDLASVSLVCKLQQMATKLTLRRLKGVRW
jgi:IS1 family transposase